MTHTAIEMKFPATPEKGEVSALLVRPDDASHLLVLGHGASTNIRHATLTTIAERMAGAGIATFRYNFPYMEHGTGRDSKEVCTATVRSAVAAAHRAAPDIPLLAGGHSFGGRMTSTAASESPLDDVDGLVFFSFPLHQPGKPDTKRAVPWRTSTFYNPSARDSANARLSTYWTLPTTAFAPSNAPAQAKRMYSTRWLASSGSGRPG